MSDFGRLLALEIPVLRRYSRKLTRNPDDAEDLLQGCLLRAIEKEQRWQPGTSLRSWLLTMLHHQQIVLGGMSYGEAATTLAIPIGTVRSRTSRARTALRKRVMDDAETGTLTPPPARPAASAANTVCRLAA
jgi:DNA-directed RNA polymerase specialized sigma24 family protein